MQKHYQHIVLTSEGPVAHVRLNRPEVHNAFDSTLIAEITEAFTEVASVAPDTVRVVVLSGAGKSFCAGADVNWMRSSLDFTHADNVADASRMAEMFSLIDRTPAVVICRVQGAALGGGAGLAAVSDIVVAEENARFAFSEAKLGIAPAVISPYVLRKIGLSHARALFFTAERFSAHRALQIGLVHRVVSQEELEPEIDRLVNEVLSSSPAAIARAKTLIAKVPTLTAAEATSLTVETIADLRASPEGQEGLQAFLEKRKPQWSL